VIGTIGTCTYRYIYIRIKIQNNKIKNDTKTEGKMAFFESSLTVLALIAVAHRGFATPGK